MKIKEVGITKTRIRELQENFIFKEGNFPYTSRISFDEIPFELADITNFHYGTTSYDRALALHSETIRQFDSIGIHNGDEVVVLFEKANSNIIAIGKPESNKWIDVNDYFKIKVFNDFNLFITDLTVY